MSKVLLTFYDLGLGGVQTKLIAVANKLAVSNHEVVLCVEHSDSHSRHQKLHKRVKYLSAWSGKRPWIRRWYYLWLWLVVSWVRPDVVVVSLEETAVRFVSFKKYFSWIHSPKIVVNMDIYLKAVQSYSITRLKETFSQVDTIVAVSKQIEDDLCDRIGVPSSKVICIPNWPTLSSSIMSRKLKPLSSRKYQLVFMGRFVSQKRPEACLLYFHRELTKDHSLQLHFFGEGPLREKLHLLAERLKIKDKVFFHDVSEKPEEILAETQKLLLFSIFEGCPQVILEAQEFGCRVVVSKEVQRTLPVSKEYKSNEELFISQLVK